MCNDCKHKSFLKKIGVLQCCRYPNTVLSESCYFIEAFQLLHENNKAKRKNKLSFFCTTRKKITTTCAIKTFKKKTR
jgi:hypothetical protein